jgi:hypothetical protein
VILIKAVTLLMGTAISRDSEGKRGKDWYNRMSRESLESRHCRTGKT